MNLILCFIGNNYVSSSWGQTNSNQNQNNNHNQNNNNQGHNNNWNPYTNSGNCPWDKSNPAGDCSNKFKNRCSLKYFRVCGEHFFNKVTRKLLS